MSKSQPLLYLDVGRKGPNKKIASLRAQHFAEIYDPFESLEMRKQAGRCLDCGNPYCEWRCPLHNYIPNWLALVEEGQFAEAAELMHQTNSLPEVCGRVCPQDRLCEGSCTLNDDFGAVTIGAIEQAVTDNAIAAGWSPDLSGVIRSNKRVAVIGAGPAGLGCADILLRQGIDVDVYERQSEIGGLLTFGIPAFKLDKQILVQRRKLFEQMGVIFHLNQDIDANRFASLIEDYDAIFLGMGAYQSVSSGLENENSAGVYSALDYLIAETQSQLDNSPNAKNLAGKKVAVLGGGDTAMDCTRTAIRQGAEEVYCIYRRDQRNMPGSQREITNALEEGVTFLFNQQAHKILTNADGQVSGLDTVKTQLAERDASGRQAAQIVLGSEQFLAVDAVIVAFGFQASPAPWFAEQNINIDARGRVSVEGYQSTNPKVFAGGDMVRGSDLVVTAVYDGREAGKAIATWLMDSALTDE